MEIFFLWFVGGCSGRVLGAESVSVCGLASVGARLRVLSMLL